MTWHCEQGISLYCDGIEVVYKEMRWFPRTVAPQFPVGGGQIIG